ncbi:MAG: putative membrane protein [Limisphaerales bacterium]
MWELSLQKESSNIISMDAEPRELIAVLGGSIIALMLSTGIGLIILGKQFEREDWSSSGKKLTQFSILGILLIVLTWFLIPTSK